MIACRCAGIRRLDGEDARAYAAGHLRLIERGREPTGADDYRCDQRGANWVLDFPNWAQDRRGHPRLRRLPLMDGEAPVSAAD